MKPTRAIILPVLRIILGCVFVYAAWGKVWAPWSFAEAVQNYKIVGPLISRWIAVVVPLLEIIIGILLIGGIWAKEALILTVGLFFVFDAMILQAYFRGLSISCGCFHPSDASPIDTWKFIENAGLTFAAIWGLMLQTKIQYFEKKKRQT